MIPHTRYRQSLQTAINSPLKFSFCSEDMNANRLRRSRVFVTECGRAGLCSGRLLGPSMLRDISEATVRSLALDNNMAGGSGAWYSERLAIWSDIPTPGVLVVVVEI